MYFKSPSEIFRKYTNELENIKPKLMSIFEDRILTKEIFEMDVREIPKGSPGLAYYSRPSKDGRRQGSFSVNIHNTKSMTKDIVATITLHEACPGHHMQNTILDQSGELPKFLTNYVGLPGDIPNHMPAPSYLAFKEGWGLYSEFLGYDLGIYKNEPLKELGYIKGDLLRSARLVVDIGIHRFGWSRSKAIEYLMNNTGYSLETATAQVDRYISSPGQAVAYKVGEREIQRLRQKFIIENGKNLKKFHTFILKCIGPLEDLEDCVAEMFAEFDK